jgi:hypothetical protein
VPEAITIHLIPKEVIIDPFDGFKSVHSGINALLGAKVSQFLTKPVA